MTAELAIDAEEHVMAGIEALSYISAAGDWEKVATGNHGPAGDIDNGIFELRAFCWCCGCEPGHEDGCPPNFRFGDFEVEWYKHSRRGALQNRKMPFEEWRHVLIACLRSLASQSTPARREQ